MPSNAAVAESYVCTSCGYNMVGYYPLHCPFCGADRDRFLTAEECSARYRVRSTPVAENVEMLQSVPRLGLEHAAYRIDTGDRVYWIDCPSCFDRRLHPASVITFTHHHFLGASPLYRMEFPAEVWIRREEVGMPLTRGYSFDVPFEEDFSRDGIRAHRIGGHTPGFTVYAFRDILFVCDYVLFRDGRMIFNPYGLRQATREGGTRLRRLLDDLRIEIVCGVHYTMEYPQWKVHFDRLFGG
jgi:hydroxyacylglutathione hydrolase